VHLTKFVVTKPESQAQSQAQSQSLSFSRPAGALAQPSALSFSPCRPAKSGHLDKATERLDRLVD